MQPVVVTDKSVDQDGDVGMITTQLSTLAVRPPPQFTTWQLGLAHGPRADRCVPNAHVLRAPRVRTPGVYRIGVVIVRPDDVVTNIIAVRPIYVGHTTNLRRRLSEHLRGTTTISFRIATAIMTGRDIYVQWAECTHVTEAMADEATLLSDAIDYKWNRNRA